MNKNKLIKNEQIVRNRNRTVSTALKKYFGGAKEIVDSPLEFVCECSDITCEEPIKVTITEYEKLHQRNDRFLIVKGHKSPTVEKTIDVKGKLELVEKPDLAA
jgi:hypothetical protein